MGGDMYSWMYGTLYRDAVYDLNKIGIAIALLTAVFEGVAQFTDHELLEDTVSDNVE